VHDVTWRDRVLAPGGQMVMPPIQVDGVGTLGYFEDTEHNLIGVCQYEPDATFD
jgi:predicted enzyme related to lactoylglutathione lyase